ncbi:unnamed protein product, partial [Prorocentrum cordatum]
AALERATNALKAIGDVQDRVLLDSKAALLAEQARLREKTLSEKPFGAQLHQLAHRCTTLEKKKERQQAIVVQFGVDAANLQANTADAERALADTSRELVEAEAARRAAAAMAPHSEAGVYSLRATIPALDMSAAERGNLLGAIGAGPALAAAIQDSFDRRLRASQPSAVDVAVPPDDGDLEDIHAFYREVSRLSEAVGSCAKRAKTQQDVVYASIVVLGGDRRCHAAVPEQCHRAACGEQVDYDGFDDWRRFGGGRRWWLYGQRRRIDLDFMMRWLEM